jgi:citrate synthase
MSRVHVVNIDSYINIGGHVGVTGWLTAEEAAQILGIQRATLYAYVSRGWIRSEAEAGGRSRRYRRDDIEAMLRKRRIDADPTRAAEQALDFGTPLLESSIALIEDGRLYYRGRDALVLARDADVEEVAALIWTGEMAGAGTMFRDVTHAVPAICKPIDELRSLRPVERFAAILPLAATVDPAAWDLRPGPFAHAGARILAILTAAAGGTGSHRGLARRLAARWAPDEKHAEAMISAALVLCADHELNVSSFTARCVASAGGTAYNVVCAGLAALQGARHGGHTERVEALLAEIHATNDASGAIHARLRRGDEVPGFGHRLYPNGDPRGRTLIALINETHAGHPELMASEAVAHAVRDALHEHPTIDFGLATLARVLELPPGSAIALFALGRTIGWIGQAIEQIGVDKLIRPRARYVGPRPG